MHRLSAWQLYDGGVLRLQLVLLKALLHGHLGRDICRDDLGLLGVVLPHERQVLRLAVARGKLARVANDNKARATAVKEATGDPRQKDGW